MNYVYRGVIGSLGVFPPVFSIDSDGAESWRLIIKLGPLADEEHRLMVRVNDKTLLRRRVKAFDKVSVMFSSNGRTDVYIGLDRGSTSAYAVLAPSIVAKNLNI